MSFKQGSHLFHLARWRWKSPLQTFAILATLACSTSGWCQDSPTDDSTDKTFRQKIQPLIQKYCVDCHNADLMKSGVRVDQLSSQPDDRQLFLWKAVLDQFNHGSMPPRDELQPSADERNLIATWTPRMMSVASARNKTYNGAARRLTVVQYRNTLRDLLGLTEDVAKFLPPDGISKDGFTNNNQLLILSPLQVEAYFEIAEKALNLCIVDETVPPLIQNFRVDLGAAINKHPTSEKLILGANSELLSSADFVVSELSPVKPFAYQPFRMQTKFNFIEGYAGNDTVRGWRTFDSIDHAVFACVRGTPGYPFGEAHQAVPEGLLLRPAIPSSEIFGQSNTYGPRANFKISLRELPGSGNFRIKVKAARYDDGLMLEANAPANPPVAGSSIVVNVANEAAPAALISEAGIYQIDVYSTKADKPSVVTLDIAGRSFAGRLFDSPLAPPEAKSPDEMVSAFVVMRLPAGTYPLSVRSGDQSRLRRLSLHRLDEADGRAKRFTAFEKRSPSLGVHVGLRRDCGSTLTRVNEPQLVNAISLQEFVFTGAINDYPNPDVEKDNVNYLAGVREIGVRNEYTDGRDLPRLLIHSVEFEGPYFDSWPPDCHRRIFIPSSGSEQPAEYARRIIANFATRAFRRPAASEELAPINAVWDESFAKTNDFNKSIKDALLVVLTSPQFLMLIESSHGPEPEPLDPFELASKLSYFFWNTAPDARLLELAETNQLQASLDNEMHRLIQDTRFAQFVQEFASQWLSLDKFDVVSTDVKLYPTLTRDVKVELRREPVLYLQYLLQQNRPIREIVQSDFLLANDVIATYYGMGDRSESGFRFEPLQTSDSHLGGFMTQAAILAGLSDGRESNPVKRGAWVAKKIVAEPPADPPPNVPKLPEDDGHQLSLRQKLERHRNQEGCAKCHAGIDPWGLPFEQYDAGGRFRSPAVADADSQLPDGTKVQGVEDLKRYLVTDRIDQIIFGFLKHVATYAAGRSLSYHEIEELKSQSQEWKNHDIRMQDLLKRVVHSDLFLKK